MERYDTVVIGAGQAGLSAGSYLKKEGRSFVILDANRRVGDPWRHRYDSLHLFTPARYIGLPSGRFPGDPYAMPTGVEMADYLESYAERLELPVELGVRVDRIWREGNTYVVAAAGERRIEAEHVIVASGAHQQPRVPALAAELDPSIAQLHSSDYRNPSQFRPGGVLVVGAGNSGADISLDAVGDHPTWLSGPDRGHIPVDIDSWFSRHVIVRIVVFLGRHVLTVRTPVGRKAKQRLESQGVMLIRVKPHQLVAAGIRRGPKTVGVRDGKPMLEDGAVLDVTNVVWCTGYRHDLSWIDLPIFDEDGRPLHERGIVTSEPGLAFVGLPFQYAQASDVLPGVGRDARYVVRQLAKRRSPKRDLVPA